MADKNSGDSVRGNIEDPTESRMRGTGMDSGTPSDTGTRSASPRKPSVRKKSSATVAGVDGVAGSQAAPAANLTSMAAKGDLTAPIDGAAETGPRSRKATAKPASPKPEKIQATRAKAPAETPGRSGAAASDLFSSAPAQLSTGDIAMIQQLGHARLGDPFALLGLQTRDGRHVLRTYQPGAASVAVVRRLADGSAGAVLATLGQHHEAGFFHGVVDAGLGVADFLLEITWPGEGGNGVRQLTEDVYSFGPLLGELDLHLLAEGNHRELGRCLGAQPVVVDGIAGTRFAVWAPNARRVSVVGDFNHWDGRRHPMRLRHGPGVWEIFIPRLDAGAMYRYELVGFDGTLLPQKTDPVARATVVPPSTSSVVASARPLDWHDQTWMEERAGRQARSAPISIYELHPGSWRRVPEEDNRSLNWSELADWLIPYATGLGFTHVQLMPIMEHPFGGSWGYQPLNLFAPTARYGTPEQFASFVDRCHQASLGVLLDWVPAHFPSDTHGLARFDGTALYEHEDPREGFHQDWNTLIYNLGRNEVSGYLISSALEWLEHFHIDGLRVDAVASMLYRDYSRKSGEWVPNIHGGRENLEAVAFLRKLNQTIFARCPGVLMIAEESTAWPGVSAPVEWGGLGFSYKWNMGWMHDSLHYMEHDPLYRQHHHHEMTFSMHYAYTENFVLPISHDEVVHGKGSLIDKMPGDDWQKRANLRAYLAFMWTHPGKKHLFMGCELGQPGEWNHDSSLPWHLLDDPRHHGIQTLVRDLNSLYRNETALHDGDCEEAGFRWVVGDDNSNSVFAFLRFSLYGKPPLLVVANMTPVPRIDYRIGVPEGQWVEILNTDAEVYGGANIGNGCVARSDSQPGHGQPSSVWLTLPPLSVIVLRKAG